MTRHSAPASNRCITGHLPARNATSVQCWNKDDFRAFLHKIRLFHRWRTGWINYAPPPGPSPAPTGTRTARYSPAGTSKSPYCRSGNSKRPLARALRQKIRRLPPPAGRTFPPAKNLLPGNRIRIVRRACIAPEFPRAIEHCTHFQLERLIFLAIRNWRVYKRTYSLHRRSSAKIRYSSTPRPPAHRAQRDHNGKPKTNRRFTHNLLHHHGLCH